MNRILITLNGTTLFYWLPSDKEIMAFCAVGVLLTYVVMEIKLRKERGRL